MNNIRQAACLLTHVAQSPIAPTEIMRALITATALSLMESPRLENPHGLRPVTPPQAKPDTLHAV